ncbi:Transmembrane protein 87A [Papilio xuthus]|uniref:Transmembrane protein 87A n=1 Tax=Papilio xuthus TaxID=66420 RepID=A0A194PJL9_PAPXU|nr:Transmembrane protein 87A [Papilio xuthus]
MFRRFLVLIVAIVKVAQSFSDVGKWDLPLNGNFCEFTIAKSLFKDSELRVVVHCQESANVSVAYQWEQSPCSPDYFHYFEESIVDCSNQLYNAPVNEISNSSSVRVKKITCHGKESIFLYDVTDKVNDGTKKQPAASTSKMPPLIVVEREGIYVFRMMVRTNTDVTMNLSVGVEMVAPSGYLSAAMWPLLPFYGVMCGVYTVLCSAWLIVCALQWRDLLRIQYWIGAVTLLGMVESATYYGVYSAINRTGYFNAEVYMFAEWVSVAKRALTRMLVIIVSLGFGIVKPRLGPALQRVGGAALCWAVLAGAEAWLRLRRRAAQALLLAEAPISLLDSAICWWVFVSLAHTTRTLRLRRNTIKLNLYRHFTNTLIFAVISSVIFMLYSLKSYKIQLCITEWKEVWMDEAYWHMLFAGVLAVIMLLWRPTNNNQRYAFTPLLDYADDDDEEEEQFVNDAYGVKMRGTGATGSGGGGEGRNGGGESKQSEPLDELRWVEEHIPASALPVLDSDEEIVNTKFEVSKMQ